MLFACSCGSSHCSGRFSSPLHQGSIREVCLLLSCCSSHSPHKWELKLMALNTNTPRSLGVTLPLLQGTTPLLLRDSDIPLHSWIQKTSWVRASDNSNVSYGSANFSSCLTHSSQIPAMLLQVPKATATLHLNCQNTQLPHERLWGTYRNCTLQKDIFQTETRGGKQGQLYLPCCSVHILKWGTKVHLHSSCVSESTPGYTRQTLCPG